MSEQNQNANQNQGNQSQTSGSDSQLDLKATNEKLDTMIKLLDSGKQLSDADNNLLAALLAEADTGQQSTRDNANVAAKAKTAEFADLNFDEMKPRQLVETVMKMVGSEFDRLTSHFNSKIEQTQLASIDKELKAEVADVEKKYKEEFTSIHNDVMQIASKNPNLTIEQAFLLAKAASTREELTKLKAGKQEDRQAAINAVMKDGINGEALVKSVSGKKSIQETAQEIASRIGLI